MVEDVYKDIEMLMKSEQENISRSVSPSNKKFISPYSFNSRKRRIWDYNIQRYLDLYNVTPNNRILPKLNPKAKKDRKLKKILLRGDLVDNFKKYKSLEPQPTETK